MVQCVVAKTIHLNSGYRISTQERFVVGGCATPDMKQLNDTERLALKGCRYIYV